MQYFDAVHIAASEVDGRAVNCKQIKWERCIVIFSVTALSKGLSGERHGALINTKCGY